MAPNVDAAFDFSADYPHVSSMMAGAIEFDALIRAINESISNPVLSDVDQKIENLCASYLAASDEERAHFRQRVKNGCSLLHFCDKATTRALRTGDAASLDLAAAAIALDDRRCDPRDTIADLAVIHHVASRVGVDWGSFIRRLESISSTEMAQFLHGFAKRDEKTLSLDLFLRRETVDSNGPLIEYVRPSFRQKKSNSTEELSRIYGCGRLVAGEETVG